MSACIVLYDKIWMCIKKLFDPNRNAYMYVRTNEFVWLKQKKNISLLGFTTILLQRPFPFLCLVIFSLKICFNALPLHCYVRTYAWNHNTPPITRAPNENDLLSSHSVPPSIVARIQNEYRDSKRPGAL